MPKERISRRFEGHDDSEIFDRVDTRLEEFCSRYGLKKEADPEGKSLHLHRSGVKADVVVRDGVVDIDLDYSMLVPVAIRDVARERIQASLDTLFA